MKYFSIIVLMLLVAFSESTAQSLYSTGSIYSYYGVGTVTDFRDPNAAAMGMNGVGLSINGANLSNPALWGSTVLATGTGGFEVNTITSSNKTTHSSRSVIDATHFQLILPVVKQKFGISVALYPITQSNYAYQNTGTIDSAITNIGSNVTYQNVYTGSGGLNALELGFGWNIAGNLSIGYAPSIVFGKLTNDVATAFNSSYYNPTHYSVNTTNIGMGNRFGIYYQKNGVFDSNDLLSIGATASFPVILRSKKSVEDYINLNGSEDNQNRSLSNGHIRLPLRTGVGLGYWINGHWMVGAEALYQKWGDYHDINSQPVNYYTNRLRFGLGGQFLPQRSINPTFFQSLIYRAGFSYDTGYLKLQGQNISSMLLSAGFGIPTHTASSIDIDLSYGWRGTTSHDLVRERIFSVKVSFNLSELMFFKRKIQ